MPASVELLSILRSNAALRELFGDVLGSAPRLAQVIATRPHVLDAAIDPAREVGFETSLDDDRMRERVEAFVAQAPTYEEALNRARDFAAEETFHIGLNLLSGRLDPDRAGRAYSALAQGLIAVMLERGRERLRGRARARARRPGRGGRARQARLARDDRRLRSRSHSDLRFSRRRERVGRPQAARSGGLLRAADAAADRGPDRADQGGAPLRRRHAAQALRAPGAARDPALVVQALSAATRRRPGSIWR